MGWVDRRLYFLVSGLFFVDYGGPGLTGFIWSVYVGSSEMLRFFALLRMTIVIPRMIVILRMTNL
jgi:hypothetical protein